MKKIFLLLPFFLVSACGHTDQKIVTAFDLKNQTSTIGENRGLDIRVYDDRVEKQVIGTRFFSKEDQPKIKIEASLAEILRQKLSKNLMGRGFKMGNDKIIELHVNSLNYDAEIGYPIGKSKAELSLKIVILDEKNTVKFIKNYNSSLKGKHFLFPLESTIDEAVNSMLREVMQEIIEDDNLLEYLLK